MICEERAGGIATVADYYAWLRVADRGIEVGMNADAIWRLHERVPWLSKDDHDVGGES